MCLHDDALAGVVHREAADLNAVLVLDVLDVGLSDDLDELLTGIPVLEEVADLARGGGGVERDVDGEVDTTEPAGDCAQLSAGFNAGPRTDETHRGE